MLISGILVKDNEANVSDGQGLLLESTGNSCKYQVPNGTSLFQPITTILKPAFVFVLFCFPPLFF